MNDGLIMGEIFGTQDTMAFFFDQDGGGILIPAAQIRLDYYRDNPEGRREWATMMLSERHRLVWNATHGVMVDGTVYETTDHDKDLVNHLLRTVACENRGEEQDDR